jgi:hypothetical protein
MVNLATGPIPGQSLTREPGNAPYEQPPQFVDLDDAMEYMLPRILNPKTGIRIGELMEEGLPATTIADSLLLQGFTEGKWTPDLAVLMGAPLFAAIMKSAELAGFETKSGFEDEFTYEPDPTLLKLAKDGLATDDDEASLEDPEMTEAAPKPPGGLMAPPMPQGDML